MACHNRRSSTLASLRALDKSAQLRARSLRLELFVTDDGSTDDTAEAIQREFPQAHVLRGNGHLYWNGGMRKAFSAAQLSKPDFFLWLNDDTTLYPEALCVLLDQAKILIDEGHIPIIVASVVDPSTGRVSYGGVQQHPYVRGKFQLIQPAGLAQRCSTMNGNCVLISREAMELAGNLDPAFVHGGGDFDYGLRATSHGCSVWVAPGTLGECTTNSNVQPWLARNLPLRERIRQILSPKGLPARPWFVFTRRHTGILWPVYWSYPYVKLLVQHFVQSISFRRSAG